MSSFSRKPAFPQATVLLFFFFSVLLEEITHPTSFASSGGESPSYCRPPLNLLPKTGVDPSVKNCMLSCWREEAAERPDFRTIRQMLRPLQQGL